MRHKRQGKQTSLWPRDPPLTLRPHTRPVNQPFFRQTSARLCQCLLSISAVAFMHADQWTSEDITSIQIPSLSLFYVRLSDHAFDDTSLFTSRLRRENWVSITANDWQAAGETSASHSFARRCRTSPIITYNRVSEDHKFSKYSSSFSDGDFVAGIGTESRVRNWSD